MRRDTRPGVSNAHRPGTTIYLDTRLCMHMMLRDQTRVALFREKIADVVGRRCGGGGWVDAHSLDFHGLSVARQRLELANIAREATDAFLKL